MLTMNRAEGLSPTQLPALVLPMAPAEMAPEAEMEALDHFLSHFQPGAAPDQTTLAHHTPPRRSYSLVAPLCGPGPGALGAGPAAIQVEPDHSPMIDSDFPADCILNSPMTDPFDDWSSFSSSDDWSSVSSEYASSLADITAMLTTGPGIELPPLDYMAQPPKANTSLAAPSWPVPLSPALETVHHPLTHQSLDALELFRLRHPSSQSSRSRSCGSPTTGDDSPSIHSAAGGVRRRYTCGFCPKAFVTPSKLARHKRVHTGDKPYSCACCPQRFTQRCGLKAHSYLHARETMTMVSDCDSLQPGSPSRLKKINGFLVSELLAAMQRTAGKKEQLEPSELPAPPEQAPPEQPAPYRMSSAHTTEFLLSGPSSARSISPAI